MSAIEGYVDRECLKLLLHAVQVDVELRDKLSPLQLHELGLNDYQRRSHPSHPVRWTDHSRVSPLLRDKVCS